MVAAGDKLRTLIVLRRTPYGSSLAKASIDVAFASAAFEQPVDLLFLGDGVLQLYPNQDGHALGIKTLGRHLAALPLYGISSVYVDCEAVARYKLDLSSAPVDSIALDADGVRQLMQRYDHLLGF
jgi:tRNA 2-thiouridine synthesizing protein C